MTPEVEPQQKRTVRSRLWWSVCLNIFIVLNSLALLVKLMILPAQLGSSGFGWFGLANPGLDFGQQIS